MRIVIDLQGAQTRSRQRGIGRFTLSLAQAIVRNRGKHQIFLALNGLFPDTIEPIRAAFDSLLPQENICVWQSPEPVHQLDEANTWHRHSAELVREAFLASLKPDLVLICSLFEGLDDNAIISIGTLSCTVPTAVILYDLIPLIYSQHYLINPQNEAWYQRKLDHLRRADLLLAISEASQQDAINHLGFPIAACINISAAAEPYFQPQNIDSQQEKDIRQHYGIQRKFVMYTGGIDYRKNMEGIIRAYAKLPRLLRSSHQLVIICSIQPSSRAILEELAKDQGLDAKELVLTGFVPEEDLLTLYNLCKTFVFPSWYEGFGLPVLEAMACGRAVIGANTSGLPEVIGKEEALFDPFNDSAIAEKLVQVLTDDSFRLELEQHGLAHAKRFSWDSTAQRAITAMETLHIKQAGQSLTYIAPISRPKLAYVSPLPPERSGISDYSAELLPELASHYTIDVIVAQPSVSDPWIQANCQIRSLEWFRTYADRYDRVLYHFGNSSFHQHMFSLIKEIPGIVVLHDFFLGNLLAHMERVSYQPNAWTQALYQSHGYTAVQQRFYQLDTAIWHYPCNLTALDSAHGVIVHTEYSNSLANQWYGKGAADDWAVIPHLRVRALNADRVTARRQLELTDNDFVVCSFGMLGPSKQNHRLLTAWLASTLAKSNHCVLVFVGENHGGDYGADLITTIFNSGLKQRIHITGWANKSTFCHYLAAADIAVQLRSLSRGETSGTVLDCMNYALPTIVNANGSMAALPDDGVWKLPDEFSDAQLIEALETLWRDPFRRQRLGERAQKIIHTQHVPRHCADKYAQSIENMYRTMHAGVTALTNALAEIQPVPVDPNTWLLLANAIGQSIPPKLRVRQLFVDISELIQRDVGSGIQRVTRSILHELLSNPPAGYRVEPVYAESDGKGYRYARNYTLNMLNCSDAHLGNDDVIDFYNGDLFLGLDLHYHAVLAHQWFYQQMRNYGVQIYFLLYDLLPIQSSHFWLTQSEIKKIYHDWLKVLSETADGAICISQTIANALTEWLKSNAVPLHRRPFKIDWTHLGADIKNSLPSKGIPDTATEVFNALALNKNFLMVGTLEPRKGHTQTLEAFEQLWAQGIAVNLVIVGKQGWMVEALVEKLRHHPQLGKQLFWLEGISDEYLEKIYDVSNCLIAASEGEGFGLPLIEAAQHKLPIIVRNIPVFREVAGDHAYYFNGLEPSDLAQAIQQWLKLDLEHRAPSSEHMPWLTWAESTQQLLAKILPST